MKPLSEQAHVPIPFLVKVKPKERKGKLLLLNAATER